MVIKNLFYHFILALFLYGCVAISECEPNIENWSIIGTIIYLLTFTTWSIAITINTIIKDERK